MSRHVYVMNKSGHDYSAALQFADEIVYLSEGTIDRYQVNQMYRVICEKMRDSTPDDYILITSLPILTAIATGIFVQMHGRLNLLLYKSGRYVERKLLMGELVKGESCDTI